jgi:hypothetical protein
MTNRISYGAKTREKDLELIIADRDSALRGSLKIQLLLKGITIYEELLHEEFAKVYGLDPLLLEPEHLKVKYALPGKLRSLIYCGRTDADIAI